MDILRSVKTATLRNRFDSHKKDPYSLCKITKDVRFFVQNKSLIFFKNVEDTQVCFVETLNDFHC